MLQIDAAPGIHRIEDAYVNWYLVEDSRGRDLTIVDAGHPASFSSLLSALRRIGRRPSDVRAVVLTHAHFDHVGFAERVRSEFGVPVYVHAHDAELAHHPWQYEHERMRLPYALRHPRFVWVFANMTVKGAPLVSGIEEIEPLDDTGTLDVPGQPQIVFSPGHTHGHCAFYLPDRDALISGDALVTFDPYTATPGAQIVAGAATADSERALSSLTTLATTGAQIVLPGHGEPWREGIQGAVDIALAAGAH